MARLQSLQQGKRPVTDYVSEFRQVSVDVARNEPSLMHHFRLGLSGAIKDELARVDRPKTLSEAIALSIRIDERLRERELERRTENSERFVSSPASSPRTPPVQLSPTSNYASETGPGPMQIDATRSPLTHDEREHGRQHGLCFYCGKPGHAIEFCPFRPKKGMGKSQVQSR